jgi:hypothetical protein
VSKNLYALAALLSFVSMLQAQPINAFPLDDFNVAPGFARDTVLDGSGVWAGFNVGTAAVGGYRVIGNYMTDALPNYAPSTTEVTSGAFTINNSAVVRSAGQAIWQGSDATPNTDAIIAHPVAFNLGNLNLNTLLSSPNFNVQWSVLSSDFRTWQYTFRAYTNDANNYFEAVLSSNQSGVVLSMPRESFVAIGNPDWSDIDAFSFSTTYNTGPLGGDFAMTALQIAVPEVSSYLLLLATAVGVGGYCWMKHRRSRVTLAFRS